MNNAELEKRLATASVRLDAAEAALREARQSITSIADLIGSNESVAGVPEFSAAPPGTRDTDAQVAQPKAASPHPASATPRSAAPRSPAPQRAASTSATPKEPQPFLTEKNIVRLMAVAGALVTLAGVGFLVVVAIESGLFGPHSRVVAAFILSLLLLAGAWWLERRKAQVPAIALAVTSCCTAITTIYACYEWLHWWPRPIGQLLAFAVAAFFAGLARYWRFETQAIFVGISLFVLALVDSGPSSILPATLPALLILSVTIGMKWANARQVASYLAIIGVLFLFEGVMGMKATSSAAVFGVTSALALIGFMMWDRIATTQRADKLLGIYAPTVMLSLVAFPAFLKPEAQLAAFIGAVVMTALGFSAVGVKRGIASPGGFLSNSVAVWGLCLSAVTFLTYWLAIRRDDSRGAGRTETGLELSEALVGIGLILAICVLLWLSRTPRLGPAPWFAWTLLAIAVTAELGAAVIAKKTIWLTGWTVFLVALLLAAFVVTAIVCRASFARFSTGSQLFFGFAALYFSMVAIVTIFTHIFHLFLGQTDKMSWLGFHLGHAMVSVLWLLIASYLLLSKKLLDNSTATTAGFLLAVAALVKLVFYDMPTLTGLSRVFAFIGSGIVLLAIAVVRSQRRDEAGTAKRGDVVAATSPASNSPAGNSSNTPIEQQQVAQSAGDAPDATYRPYQQPPQQQPPHQQSDDWQE